MLRSSKRYHNSSGPVKETGAGTRTPGEGRRVTRSVPLRDFFSYIELREYYHDEQSDRRDYAFFSTGLAVENLMLQATKEGLIAHPIAGCKPLPLKEAFGVDPEMILLTLVVIGYPGDEAHLSDKHRELEHSARDRKPEDQVIMYNRWLEVNA